MMEHRLTATECIRLGAPLFEYVALLELDGWYWRAYRIRKDELALLSSRFDEADMGMIVYWGMREVSLAREGAPYKQWKGDSGAIYMSAQIASVN